MFSAMRLVFALVLISAICFSSSLAAPSSDDSQLSGPAMAFMAKRSFSGYMPWSKKWARLEPSIRFFKRSGVQPVMYEDDAMF